MQVGQTLAVAQEQHLHHNVEAAAAVKAGLERTPAETTMQYTQAHTQQRLHNLCKNHALLIFRLGMPQQVVLCRLTTRRSHASVAVST